MSTYAFVSQRHILIALLMPINGYVCLTTSAKANPLCLSAFSVPICLCLFAPAVVQVKSLFDVVYLPAPGGSPGAVGVSAQLAPVRGLRAVIGRGAPLDLGEQQIKRR